MRQISKQAKMIPKTASNDAAIATAMPGVVLVVFAGLGVVASML